MVAEWCVFWAVQMAYFATLGPSVVGGDSGELLAEAYQLGTAHPPGYPLFTLIMHPVLHLPRLACVITTPAAWANLMCGICGAAAAAMICGAARDLCCSSWSGFAAGCLYAFSPLVWQYSATAEVFALNNLLCALMVRYAILYAKFRRPSYTRWGALCCGLALSNQHTSVLFVVPLVIWMLMLLGNRPLELARLGALFLVGLLPYAYLPVRAATNPKPGSWGNVITFRGFVNHLLRRDYGTLRLYSGKSDAAESLGNRLAAYLTNLNSRQSSPRGLIPSLAIVGFAALCLNSTIRVAPSGCSSAPTVPAVIYNGIKEKTTSKARRRERMRLRQESQKSDVRAATREPEATTSSKGYETSRRTTDIGLALAATLASYLLVFHSLANLPLRDPLLFGIFARFWMQPNIIVCIWVGVGLEAVLGLISSKALRASLAILLVSLQLQLGLWPQGDDPGAPAGELSWRLGLSRSPPAWYFADYARAILEPLPVDALLLINYDQQWTSLRYAQVCERVRPDVTLLQLSMMTYEWWQTKRHLYPHIVWPGTFYTREGSVAWAQGAFTVQEFIDANYGAFPIFLGGKLSFADQGYKDRFEFIPHGLVSRIYAKQDLPTVIEYVRQSRRVWNTTLANIRRLPFEEEGYSQETWEWTITREA